MRPSAKSTAHITAVPAGTTLGELRTLSPHRTVTRHEAEYVAERQANRLLKAAGVVGPPSPLALFESIDRVKLDIWPNSPVSGSCHWTGQTWMILVNGKEPSYRRRFTAFHELKHAIDHPEVETLYAGMKGTKDKPAPELICDHFAACVLMPKIFIRRAWTMGLTDVSVLADLFDVSPTAMRHRLTWLGLLTVRIDKQAEVAA